MKLRVFAVCLLVAAPALSPGANKEIQDLQRDIAILQQSFKDWQKSHDEKMAALLDLLRQANEAANRANTGVAAVNNSLDKNLKDLPDKMSGPVAGLASRISEMAADIRTLLQSNSDMVAQLTRVQSKLNDIENQVKAVNIAVAPPPGPSDPPAGERPPMPASALYGTALQDYRSGKYEMALQGFASYLKWYPADALAPDAHFYTGSYYFGQKDFEKAVAEFDQVKAVDAPTNSKLSSAMLYRGKALALMPGHKTEGANEFIDLIKKFPQSDDAKQACEGLKELGRNCPVAAAPAGRRNE